MFEVFWYLMMFLTLQELRERACDDSGQDRDSTGTEIFCHIPRLISATEAMRESISYSLL
jgi:hypothetical protein